MSMNRYKIVAERVTPDGVVLGGAELEVEAESIEAAESKFRAEHQLDKLGIFEWRIRVEEV